MNLTLSQRLLTLFLTTMISFGAMAQEVQWSHKVELYPNSAEAVLELTATMEEGWHLYDMEVPEDGPQATVISFEGSEGVEPQGGIVTSVESIKAEDSTFGIVIGFWEDTVTFTQRFTLTSPTGVIKGKVTFMACDDRNCMPPQSYTFSCDVSSTDANCPTSDVEVLNTLKDASKDTSKDTASKVVDSKNITSDDIETCCCIGWGSKKQ